MLSQGGVVLICFPRLPEDILPNLTGHCSLFPELLFHIFYPTPFLFVMVFPNHSVGVYIFWIPTTSWWINYKNFPDSGFTSVPGIFIDQAEKPSNVNVDTFNLFHMVLIFLIYKMPYHHDVMQSYSFLAEVLKFALRVFSPKYRNAQFSLPTPWYAASGVGSMYLQF